MCCFMHLLPPQVVAPEVVHEQRIYNLQSQKTRIKCGGAAHQGVLPMPMSNVPQTAAVLMSRDCRLDVA